MLTVEHLQVMRRQGKVHLRPRCGLSDDDALILLSEARTLGLAHHGRPRGELVEALNELVVPERHLKASRAAQKLIVDACDFAPRDDVDPAAVRQALFEAAAEARRAEGAGGPPFDRAAVVAAVAPGLGLTPAEVDELLYADLEEARLVDASALRTISDADLLDRWDLAEHQALVLRCQSLRLWLPASGEGGRKGLRRLLAFLKLLQLLFEVEPPTDGENRDGVVLRVSGPMGLFSSSMRYGLKLAMVLPRLRDCGPVEVEADVQLRRGQPTATHRFVVDRAEPSDPSAVTEDGPSPLVQGLLEQLPAQLPDWQVGLDDGLVSVPGVGGCAPDLKVTSPTGQGVGVEVLGFWSRDAVWRRVAMAKAGVDRPLVFCVSERLRVSEQALDGVEGGEGGSRHRVALVTFKGALSAKKVAAAVRAVTGEADSR